MMPVATPSDLGRTGMASVPCPVAERVALLSGGYRNSSLHLDELSGPELEGLARFAELCRAPRGAVVFHEGAREIYFCLIVAGEIEIRKEDGRQVEQVLATLGPGKSLGEIALVDGQPRSATAVAHSDATLIVLTREGFDSLVDEFPRLGVKLLRNLARLLSARLRETSGRLVDHLGA